MNGLEKFRNIHKGERAFGVCGGTSLGMVDRTKLQGEILFGANRVHIADAFKINYLFVTDRRIAEQFADDFSRAPVDVIFIPDSFAGIFNHPNEYYFRGFGDWVFHKDVTERIHGGRTTSFVMMQFAYYMGIQEMYFVGLDHYWSEENSTKEGRLLTTQGKDVNHFREDYYGDGVEWYQPKYEAKEKSYSLAVTAFEEDGRKLMNASPWTKLSEDVMPRIDYEEIFKNG